MMNFTDKVVVVTGAAGGIGSAIARRFLAEGARVCASDVSDKVLGQLVQDLGTPAKLLTVAADISSEESCQQLAAQVKDKWGAADIVINNAGWFPFQEFEEITYEDWRKVTAINLDGTFLMSKAFLPLLKNSPAGRIINISSGSVLSPPPNQAHYVAAKAGVVGFTRALAMSVGQYNITVNAILPGVVATAAALKSFPPGLIDQIAAQGALKRREEAEDLVGSVVFLASDDAAFFTGQSLSVDGGRHFI